MTRETTSCGAYLEELREIYRVECRALGNLPNLIKTATSLEKKQAYERHLKFTHDHIQRLRDLFIGIDREDLLELEES